MQPKNNREKSRKPKIWFFEKIYESNKSLLRKKTQIANIRNAIEDITTDPADIKNNKGILQATSQYRFDILAEINHFSKHRLPKLTQ